MSKVKKILSVMMAMVMVLAMSISTFAATPGDDRTYGTQDDRGKITVKGIESTGETSISVKAYKVIAATYDTNGYFSGYESLYTDAVTNDDIKPDDQGKVTITQGQMVNLVDKVSGSTGITMIKDTNGDYVADDVEPGTYLVLVTGTEETSYNPMVVSVSYVRNSDGTTGLDETALDITDGVATAKKSDKPKVDKKILDSNGSTADGNSVHIGDTVKYSVSVKPIPNYAGKYPVLNVVDTLSDGLTYQDDLIVTVDGKELAKNAYTVTHDRQEIKVDFVVKGNNYTLNEYSGKEAVITYSAKVNENAKVNELGNGNDAVLNFSRDSKTENDVDDDEDKTYTYTFEIDGTATGTTGIINKKGDKTDDEGGLDDATFGLYETQEKAENDTTTTGRDAFQVKKSKTIGDKKGQLNFKGLKEGTYYLKELSAPNGYSVNTHIFEIKIEATYNTNQSPKIDYGKLISWRVLVDGTPIASFTANSYGTWDKDITGADVMNTQISSLPSTGGIGTTIFTIGGCAIMIVAAGLFFATRRKTQK